MSDTIVLGYPNEVDATFFEVEFSGGSWLDSLPLQNLRSPLLAHVARSTDLELASTQFDVDLGVPRRIQLFCIPLCNLSRAALIRIRGSETDSFGEPVYDSGWVPVWTVVYPWGSIDWGHPSFWDGKMEGEAAQDYGVAFIHIPESPPRARHWRWEIDDRDNDAGHVELNRLFMSPGWQPSVNMSYGAGLGIETNTVVQESDGGVRFYDRKRSRRVLRFAINYLQQDEALAQAFEMQRRLGKDRQLFVVADPTATTHLHRLSFLGTMTELSPLEFTIYDHLSVAFQIEEVL